MSRETNSEKDPVSPPVPGDAAGTEQITYQPNRKNDDTDNARNGGGQTINAASVKNNGNDAPLNLHTEAGKIAFIETVLFVSKDPVEPERIMNFLKLRDINEFERLIMKMDDQYQQENRGIMIKRAGGGVQLTTKPNLHDFLKEFFTIKSTSRLSLASLESLAIIAYRQPATIAEISDLRGVNSIGPVKNLLQKKLVRISGRKKVPGLPALYSTTREFLLYFGLKDLSELPSLEELTEMFEEKEQPSLFKEPL